MVFPPGFAAPAAPAAATAATTAPMVETPDDNNTPPPKQQNAADARYSFDDEKLTKLRTDAPWTKETKYFTSVAISPSAIMKMVST
jgi:hypothetical protein